MSAIPGGKSPSLWIALDGLSENQSETLAIAHQLDGTRIPFGNKVNLDWLLMLGCSNAARRLPLTRRRFADLKMWNGARTMARTFANLHEAGFELTNAYALAGGYEDLKSRAEELKRAIAMFRDKVGKTQLKIYALTVLSHYDESWCQRQLGTDKRSAIRRLAEEGVAAGCDGIIFPGAFLPVVDDLKTGKLLTGGRTSWYSDKEHADELRLEDIAGRGDLEFVLGSTIMKHGNPAEALHMAIEAVRG